MEFDKHVLQRRRISVRRILVAIRGKGGTLIRHAAGTLLSSSFVGTGRGCGRIGMFLGFPLCRCNSCCPTLTVDIPYRAGL